MCKISIDMSRYENKYNFLRAIILNQSGEFTVDNIYQLANKVRDNAVQLEDILNTLNEAINDENVVRLNGKYYPTYSLAYSER